MLPVTGNWDATSPDSWATHLGLVRRPLFWTEDQAAVRGEAAAGCNVLLDGRGASAAFFVSDTNDIESVARRLGLVWSANLHHLVLIDSQRARVGWQRWDVGPAEHRYFDLPRSATAASVLLDRLDETAPPRELAVDHTMRLFFRLRHSLPGEDGLLALQVLNALLVAVAHAAAQGYGATEWRDITDGRLRTVGALASFLRDVPNPPCVLDVPPVTAALSLGEIPSGLCRQTGPWGTRLDPALMLRHAVTVLYQQAHLVLRRHRQLTLPIEDSDQPLRGAAPRDVHYTPRELTRALVQAALDALPKGWMEWDRLTVLDPACGSGMFLVEALHELAQRGFPGEVALHGMDVTEVSCEMARFALAWTQRDMRGRMDRIVPSFRQADALSEPWPECDVVAMNPPFIAWRDMTAAQRRDLRDQHPALAKRRPDYATAFVLRALGRVQPEGGVVASVLPSSLLSSHSGQRWRQEVQEVADLRLVGQFTGYSYFPGAAISPGFVVASRRPTQPAAERPSVSVLLAEPGAEGAAIRRWRKGLPGARIGSTDLQVLPQEELSRRDWRPRPSHVAPLADWLERWPGPRVDDLFAVHQGALTGNNDAFVVPADEILRLPTAKRSLFRPAAGNSTIRDGRLSPTEYVFYPYGPDGLLLRTEDELDQLPAFYRRRLAERRDALRTGRPVDQALWWGLTRPRAWQYEALPKLVSAYFGGCGRFAYDESGSYVVVQGYGWLWRGHSLPETSFHASVLPFAYLALLNSSVFERALALLCPRVRGGQLNLSARFVSLAPMPDLAQEEPRTQRAVAALSSAGRRLHLGLPGAPSETDLVVADLYGLDPDVLVSSEGA